ncbi:MAG: hypothetical protein EXX96DRAFT_536858 [Benjaminiella poitrasii]|nr:MAG: hypothetical protein EXX96DRAFT_536858 [Benjaminiella poitrasii]
MGYKLGKKVGNYWQTNIVNELKGVKIESKASRSKSTFQSSNSNRLITPEKKDLILKKISQIKKDNKWVLSTNKVVEDTMKSLIQETMYEHPVHSLILDPNDPIWVNYFDENELEEIRATNVKKMPDLPLDISAYISTYETYITARDMHKFAYSNYHDPIEEFDRKWVQESLIEASERFIRDAIVKVDEYSELDTIINIWSFVYKAFSDRQIKAMLGEKPRQRKSIGAKVDILFKCGLTELGACEVGLHDVIEVDEKYMNDCLLKLPKTLRDILSILVSKNEPQINNLAAVGYTMMGLSMELIVADVPVGTNVLCILSSSALSEKSLYCPKF